MNTGIGGCPAHPAPAERMAVAHLTSVVRTSALASLHKLAPIGPVAKVR